MTTATVRPYVSKLHGGSAGFGHLLRAEWTKFRTVRGWVIGVVIAALVIVAIALLDHSSCGGTLTPGGSSVAGVGCSSSVGPGGEAVTDSFYFVHQPLAGDGSITVRVTSLTAQSAGPASLACSRGPRQGSSSRPARGPDRPTRR